LIESKYVEVNLDGHPAFVDLPKKTRPKPGHMKQEIDAQKFFNFASGAIARLKLQF